MQTAAPPPPPLPPLLQDKTNTLFSGTVVTAGRARGVVVGTGAATAIGKIRWVVVGAGAGQGDGMRGSGMRGACGVVVDAGAATATSALRFFLFCLNPGVSFVIGNCSDISQHDLTTAMQHL